MWDKKGKKQHARLLHLLVIQRKIYLKLKFKTTMNQKTLCEIREFDRNQSRQRNAECKSHTNIPNPRTRQYIDNSLRSNIRTELSSLLLIAASLNCSRVALSSCSKHLINFRLSRFVVLQSFDHKGNVFGIRSRISSTHLNQTISNQSFRLHILPHRT